MRRPRRPSLFPMPCAPARPQPIWSRRGPGPAGRPTRTSDATSAPRRPRAQRSRRRSPRRSPSVFVRDRVPSGTTTGGGGLQYNSVGDATLKLTTHEANSDLLKSYTITNNRTSNTFVIKDNASSVDAFEISDSRNIHGQTVKLHNLTTAQINALSSPQAGDMVFNTTLNQVCVYNGSAWQKLTQSAM